MALTLRSRIHPLPLSIGIVLATACGAAAVRALVPKIAAS